MHNEHRCSRRDLIMQGMLTAAVSLGVGGSMKAAVALSDDATAPWRGLKIGVASYTLRTMPLEMAIKAIQRVGLRYVSIKDFHLPLKSTGEERRAVVQKFKASGIAPLSCGVIGMPNEAAARRAFEYARDAGIPTIVCNPSPQIIPALDKLVKEFDIRLAIHNHGPESKDFRSPLDVWPAIENYDKRIGLCVDVGHTVRVKVDPAESILKCRERVYDVHIKDVSRAEAQGHCIEGGRGIVDFKAIFQALLAIRFDALVGIEYEKDGDDPLPGLAETVGYMRGVLSGIKP